jgi:hypothetical protein
MFCSEIRLKPDRVRVVYEVGVEIPWIVRYFAINPTRPLKLLFFSVQFNFSDYESVIGAVKLVYFPLHAAAKDNMTGL